MRCGVKKYEYVSLCIDGWIFGSTCEEHRKIIDEKITGQKKFTAPL